MTDSTTDATAAAVNIKLPPFCATDVLPWFQRVEVQFRIRNLTSETKKADHVLAALPPETFSLISEWLLEQGDAQVHYTDLKKQILRNCVATPEERAHRLMELTRLPLGDQRPSAAFAEMKALTRLPYSDNCTDKLDLLRVLWLLRLPSDVSSKITDFTQRTEQKLVDLADSLQGAAKISAPRSTLAVSNTTEDEETPSAAAVRKPPPQKNYTYRKQDQEGLCFYHKRFGDKARRCQAPCSWPKNAYRGCLHQWQPVRTPTHSS